MSMPFTSAFAAISPDALDPHRYPPPRRYLLVRDGDDDTRIGVMPAGRVAMLAAAGGAGKTYALIQLAIAVATNGRWLGAWQALGSGRILLALGEEDAEETLRRIWEVAQSLGLSHTDRAACIDRIRVAPLASARIALTDANGVTTPAHADLVGILHTECGPDGWSLVIADPLTRLAGPGAENDNALATALVIALEQLTKAPGYPTVMIAHHTSQAARTGGIVDATASRGVTGLTDGIRWQATMAVVAGTSDVLTLHVGKTNYAPQPPDLALQRGPRGALTLLDPIVARTIGSEVSVATAFVLALVEQQPGISVREIVLAAQTTSGGPGYGKQRVLGALRDLETRGTIFQKKTGRRVEWFAMKPAPTTIAPGQPDGSSN